ncbi:MAG: VWA domain-containing protein [Acidobacteriota bacterium]|nr:VWA domain-containing protein [Acidobacteriota bacterium]
MPRLVPILLASVLAASALASARVEARTVATPAWVAANDCGPAPKFQATINGKATPVIKALGPSSDQMILLVSDLTSNLSLIESAKQALISQISKLPLNTWIGLLRAQDGLHVVANPEANRKPAISAIQSLSNTGQPGLLGTVTPALTLASAIMRKAPIRVSVLYITDGSIYSYPEDYTNPVINASDPYDLSRAFPDALIDNKISTLMGNLSSSEAPLFVVQLEFRRDGLSEAYQNGIKALARATGGESESCQSQAEIPEVIADMFNRISNTWLLTLALPPGSQDGRIQVNIPCHNGNLRLPSRTYFKKDQAPQ